MTSDPRRLRLRAAPGAWDLGGDPLAWDWRSLPSLSPFQKSDGSAASDHPTEVRLCANAHALFARFDCSDRDIWGTFRERDDPVYSEEAVEIFIAPGAARPREYFEFEVSPMGVLFDARVRNPDSRRETMEVDVAWDCPGIRWNARIDEPGHHWAAALVIPWRSLVDSRAPLPRLWRANLFRIERPHDGPAEFSCWIPTLATPPDFHKPECFGEWQLADQPPAAAAKE